MIRVVQSGNSNCAEDERIQVVGIGGMNVEGSEEALETVEWAVAHHRSGRFWAEALRGHQKDLGLLLRLSETLVNDCLAMVVCDVADVVGSLGCVLEEEEKAKVEDVGSQSASLLTVVRPVCPLQRHLRLVEDDYSFAWQGRGECDSSG